MEIWVIMGLVGAFCLYSVLANLILLALCIKIWTELSKALQMLRNRS